MGRCATLRRPNYLLQGMNGCYDSRTGGFIKGVSKETSPGYGTWDPEQKFLFLADGSNDRIHVLLRDSLEELTSFGDGGRQPGQFYAVHSIASDSKGNLYTVEIVNNRRAQRFVQSLALLQRNLRVAVAVQDEEWRIVRGNVVQRARGAGEVRAFADRAAEHPRAV